MNNIDTAEYGIVVNHALQYSIWPTHLALLQRLQVCWRGGHAGGESQQFVETAASTYIRKQRAGESRWVDAL